MTTAPVPPESPPVPVPPPDPAVEVRAARVGACATIVGATIGVIAALIGVLATGYFDASTVNKQIDAQAQQSQLQRDAEAAQERKAAGRVQLRAAATALINDGSFVNRMEIDLFNTNCSTPRTGPFLGKIYWAAQFSKLSSDVANLDPME